MARHTRKGRNPGPVDEWLDTLGYYRKNVAYDETCLFRSVSEQMFACQLFHEKIRKDCLNYARTHYDEFKHVMREKDWNLYLDRLEKHMAVCGNLEIQIISRTYQKGILLFDGLNRCMKEVTSDNVDLYNDYLLLCHMGEDHYDVVYKRDYIQDAGFCQSMVYKALYQNVFGIQKVSNIYQTMLYHKTPFVSNQVEYLSDDNNNSNQGPFKSEKDEGFEDKAILALTISEDDDVKPMNEYEYMLKTNIAPFPFKVAKALDPTIYRNIEYDTWTEMRKEMRLGDWYYGDNNLIQGSGCIFKENGEDFHCYIQEILKNDNKCVIYITNRAEKRTVSLNCLQPEADAKPWPLPYRFSKNLMLTIPKIELPDKKNLRKKKKKDSIDCESQPDKIEGNVRAFEGAPLQMHADSNEESQIVEVPQTQSSFAYPECSWSDNTSMPPTPEPLAWSQAPQQNVVTYNTRMPTTPEVYPDHRYFYTAESYPRYNVWTNGEYVAPLPPSPSSTISPSPHAVEIPQTPDGFNYYFSDGSYSPSYYTNSAPTLPSPQVEMYAPVFPAPPPGTPVLITPDVTELVLPTPPPHIAMYTPGIEMPYLSSPFIYPPTPPPTWYHHPGMNSQGFIFPAVNPAANIK